MKRIFARSLVVAGILLLYQSAVLACHNTSITEVSATDNGDGTFTYELEICLGGNSADSESFGFWVDFTGGGNLVGYTSDVTGPSTGKTKSASVPPVSGDGSIEYGDWDDTSTDTLSPADVIECVTINLTFDEPMQEFSAGGMQPNYVSDGCEVSTSATYVCNSSATYNLNVDIPSCNNKTYTIEFNGNQIDNAPTNGGSATYSYCGDCSFDFSAYASSGGCAMNSWEIVDSNGTSVKSGTGDVIGNTVSTCTLPIELLSFSGENTGKKNVLTWITASETNNDKFIVYRSQDTRSWKKIGEINGNGTTIDSSVYKFYDKTYFKGTNYYKIRQYDYNGDYEEFSPIAINNKDAEKKIIKVVNMKGVEVEKDYKGVKIIIYQDGTTKKVMDIK